MDKLEDLKIKLEISDQKKEEEEKPKKYLDIDLEYVFTEQADIDRMIKAINAFIETNSEGLARSNYNVLGYTFKYY